MEVTSIRNQLMLLLDNLKNIQPSERDNLIKYMKTTLSQLQENDGKDKNNNANDTDHDCSSAVDGTPRSRRSMPSPTYQMKTESTDLSDFMDTNLNYLQLSADMVPEAEAVEEVNDFSELTTSVNHDTSIDSHDFPEVIDVHEFLSITDAAALNCSDPTGELNLNEAFQEDPHLLDNTSSNTSHQSPPPLSSSSGEHQLITHHETYLNCPLCRVNFDNWPSLENHLFTNHNTYSVAPVCWRCQGVFKNHAVLLAHECFDWGRLYLPCRVFMNNSNNNSNKNSNNDKNKWGKFHKFSKEELERKQFPMDGVFLSRRCGLCYKSGVTYTSYEEFEKHKSLSHSVHGVDSGFEPPSLSSRLQSPASSVTRKKKTPLKPKVSSSIHPCSDAAVRSVVRNLTERFYMLKNQKDREKQRANRRRKSSLRNRLMKRANTSAGGVVLSKRNRRTDVIHPSEAALTISITTTCNNDSADASEDNNTTVRRSNTDSTINPTATATDTNLVDTDTVETIISPTINNHEEGEKSPNYCPSTFLTSLLAAQRAKRNLTLKNKRSRQQREVSSASSPNNDANTKTSTFSCEIPSCSPSLSTSPSPSIGSSNTSEYNIENMNIRRNYWLLRQNGGRTTTSTNNNNSNNTSRRLRLQFKRKSYADFQKKKMPTTSFTDNYRVNPMKIKRFICQCCSAVFRLSSRLRVHYLFQHGHIPESLGGLSPRPNETVINCEWNQSSQENINDNNKSERTSATTTNNNNNNTADNKSESNQLSTQDNVNGGTTTTLEAVVTGHTTLASSQPSSSSSNMLNESKGNSIYLNTRNRKRKVVSGNSIIDSSTDSTACTTTTTTVRSCRRTEKSMNDITNKNGRNSRSKDVFSQDLTTDNNEIDQMISDENLPLKRHYCPECDLTFAKSFNLKRHESIIHRREYRYFCGYCEFRTGQQLAYEEHLARHFNVKQFVCEICNSRFTSKRELDDHVSFKHSTERNFVCSECDQRFKTSGTLWRHKKTHEKRVYHICSICSASFTRLSNLNRHYRRTHKRQQKVSNSQTNETEISVASKNSKRSSKNRRTKVSSTTSTVNEKASRRKNSTHPGTCIINDNQSRNTVMPIDEDDSTGVLNTAVHEDISYEQTIGEVIPVGITPQIPNDNCSSNHQTLADIFQDPHHDDDHASLSELIDITEADLNDNVVLIDHQSVAVSCSAPASSTSSTLSAVTTTSATVLTSSSSSTTECSLLSASNITAYQTVNIPDNTAVYMLNFTDLNNAAGGHAFYESTCTNLIHENNDNASHHHHHHTMMISVPDTVYHHQAAGFVDGPSVPSSSSTSVGTIGSLPSSSSSSSATVSGGTISIHPNFLLPIQLTTTSPYSSKSSTLLNSSNDNNNDNCNTADDNGDGIVGGHDVTVPSDNSHQHQQQQHPWSTVISCHPEPSLCYLITATEPLDSDISFDVDEETTTATSTTTTTTTSNNNNDNNIYTNSNTTNDSNPTSTLTVTTTNHSSNEEEGVISSVNTPSSDMIVHKQSFASVDILNSLQADVHSMNNLHETDFKSPEIVFNENCLFYESYPSTTTTMESSLSQSSSSVSSSSTALHYSTAATIWRPIDDSVGLDSVVEQHHEQQQQQQRNCHHTYQIPVVPHCSTVASTVTITSTTTSAADETLIPFSNGNCRHQINQLFPVVISESLSHNDDLITRSIGGNSGSVIAAGDDSDRLVEHIIASNQNTSVNPTDLLEDTNMMISWNPTSTITTTTTINNNNNNSNINTEFYHYQHCSPKFPSPDPNHLSSSPILSANQYHQHHHHEYDLKNFSSQTTSSSASSNHQCISNPITSLIEASGSCSSSSSDSNSNDSTNFFGQFYEHPSNTPSMNVISHRLTSGDNYNLLNNNNSICSISNLMNEANTCYDATTHSQLPDDYQVITEDSTDEQCSNFSVGYLIGHSSMPHPPPASSSSSVTSSSPSSLSVASSSTAVAPAAAAVLSSTDGLGTVINYFDNSFNHPLHCLSSNQHQRLHQQQQPQQQPGDPRSLCQSNFKNDPLDYDFL